MSTVCSIESSVSSSTWWSSVVDPCCRTSSQSSPLVGDSSLLPSKQRLLHLTERLILTAFDESTNTQHNQPTGNQLTTIGITVTVVVLSVKLTPYPLGTPTAFLESQKNFFHFGSIFSADVSLSPLRRRYWWECGFDHQLCGGFRRQSQFFSFFLSVFLHIVICLFVIFPRSAARDSDAAFDSMSAPLPPIDLPLHSQLLIWLQRWPRVRPTSSCWVSSHQGLASPPLISMRAQGLKKLAGLRPPAVSSCILDRKG